MKIVYYEQLEKPGEVDRKIVELSMRKAKLSPRQIEVCRLTIYKGLTQKDIAKKIGTSQQSVSKVFCVALSKLRKYRLSDKPKNN